MAQTVTFNTLVNHSVYTINSMFEDKAYPQEFINYLYLISTGMILYYGDSHISDIFNTIKDIQFKMYDNKDSYFNIDNSYNYLNNYITLNKNFNDIKITYELIYNTDNNSIMNMLEYLTYQINYIYTKNNKKIGFIDNIKLRYDYYKNGFISNDDESLLMNIFKMLQTEEIIKNILSLKDVLLTNKDITTLLDKINVTSDIYSFKDKAILLNLFRPLYNCDDIKMIINNSDYEDDIKDEIDFILGKNTYDKISKKVIELDTILRNFNYDDCCKRYHDFSTKYVFIRNEFVNKYIELKYA